MDKNGNRIEVGDWIFDDVEYYKIAAIHKRQFKRLYATFECYDGNSFKTYLESSEMILVPKEQAMLLELSR